MKQLNFSLVILLFISITYAQAQVISQTEEFDITQIEEKAKADARADFDISKRMTWGVRSLLLGVSSVPAALFLGIWTIPGAILGPIALSYIAQVQLPSERMNELSSRRNEYGGVYVESYQKEIKILRMKYSFLGSISGIAIPIGFLFFGTGLVVGN